MFNSNIPRLFNLTSKGPLLSELEIYQLSHSMIFNAGSRAMADDSAFLESATTPVPPSISTTPTHMPVGFTYLGQFISHDIVEKTNKRSIDRKSSPTLNLDSLYGKLGSHRGHPLYDESGKFAHNTSMAELFDVNRDEHHKALIPEPRNDENLIIIQLHRLLQQLHNGVVDNFINADPQQQSESGLFKFLSAKSIVTPLFHLVTVFDFLKRLLNKEVFNAYFNTPFESYILDLEHGDAFIPVEFSHAAFRFGHSMIRESYQLSQSGDPIALHSILRGPDAKTLTQSEQIEWKMFFDEHAKEARNIDLLVESAMSNIPTEGNIVAINLMAAESLHIPSGEQVLNKIKSDYPTLAKRANLSEPTVITRGVYESEMPAFALLESHFNNGTAPLWLYILREAGIETNPAISHKQLGKLGSIVVAEVLRKSILRCYQPQLWRDQTVEQLMLNVFKKNHILDKYQAHFGDVNELNMQKIIDFIG